MCFKSNRTDELLTRNKDLRILDEIFYYEMDFHCFLYTPVCLVMCR